MKTQAERISVVLPVLNEEATLPALAERIERAMAACGVEYEVIFVDDGSADSSAAIIESLHARNPRFKLISLSRNFGQQSALSAGLEHAAGQAVILMDADLQDPPEILPQMVDRWREGYEVVYVVRASRSESLPKRMAFSLFYRLLNRLSQIRMPPEAGIFSLMDRQVVDGLLAMRERNRYLSGLRAWTGFRQIGVPLDRPPRHSGSPRQSLRKLMRLASDAFFSFSYVPLRLATALGVVVALAAFGVLAWVLYVKLFTDRAIAGWASLLVAMLLLGGIQLIMLGLVGEYLGRIYDEAKARPLYIVRKKLGEFHARGPLPDSRQT